MTRAPVRDLGLSPLADRLAELAARERRDAALEMARTAAIGLVALAGLVAWLSVAARLVWG